MVPHSMVWSYSQILDLAKRYCNGKKNTLAYFSGTSVTTEKKFYKIANFHFHLQFFFSPFLKSLQLKHCLPWLTRKQIIKDQGCSMFNMYLQKSDGDKYQVKILTGGQQ
jgi:hypothetical protein